VSGVRRQLTILVAATMSLVLLAFLVPLALLLRSAAEERAISAATLRAQAAAALVSVGQDVQGDPLLTVFHPDGHTSGAAASRTPSIELAAAGSAFTAETAGGIEILVPVQSAAGSTVIRSYVPESLLSDGVARTWLALAGLGLFLFGFGLLLADRLGRRLVGSVTALAGTADRLATGDLAARVTPSGPAELRRVGAELNQLADRIGELLAAERKEVADLAHRLRTPVTALRLDVDSLRDDEERARLAADVDSLGRGVDEVIRTARRPVREGVRAYADLAAVAAQRFAFWAVLAEDTGRPASFTGSPVPVPVRTSAEDLAAALDALLENVFTHTPDDAALHVAVGTLADGGGNVAVEDAGGGPSVAHERGVAGTGLGLDIARRTAESAGGRLTVDSGPLGGTRVRLDLGPPH